MKHAGFFIFYYFLLLFFSVSNFLIEYIFKLNFSETVQGQAKEEQIIEMNQKMEAKTHLLREIVVKCNNFITQSKNP